MSRPRDRAQQRRLLGRRVGVIGLSVGGNAALTFAMEGIGGSFKLADFDPLSVSNLNRLRAGVHHLGLNKCVLAARQMLEIDPWLDIELYQGGLTDAGLSGLPLNEIDLVIPHQANPRRLRALSLEPGISAAQLAFTADTFGNTGAASIPMALHVARDHGRLHPESTVLHAAVGAGMSWAGTVQRWL
ncbi:3-oxoacyl-[acyl-carrier-protein] synthase III C-terminal domain-containing protein [Streptomyces sp. NPDC090022]|uniref:3-oxoacyl-[acyl-carrier-protein] synthase III C-terminal domain-containing protein n=1 Tax=Streptomyces sp. NPDC090022 TaxID=3365920 RepID=UPI003823C25E